MLITYRGLSGPAILQISSYWDSKSPIPIDLAPNTDITYRMRHGSAGRDLKAAKSAFRALLSEPFADRWVELHAPQRWTNSALEQLEHTAHHWEITLSIRHRRLRQPRSHRGRSRYR
jgi:predicted flavoprotein YhiN